MKPEAPQRIMKFNINNFKIISIQFSQFFHLNIEYRLNILYYENSELILS